MKPVNKNRNTDGIGIGMMGYSFMGKAHSNAYLKMPYIFWPPPAKPRLIKICGRDKKSVAEQAERYGYLDYCTDYHELLDDPDIDIFVNVTPHHMHAGPCIEAAMKGKHIVCEKPLAMNAAEGWEMLKAAEKAKIKHLCNYNSRLAPAMALAKTMIMEGRIGKIFHFRANYLQDWLADPDFPLIWSVSKKESGSGAVGGLSHIMDLARWLCGEPESVMAATRTFFNERPLPDNSGRRGNVDVDDAFACVIEFKNGAVGTLEASRVCPGRKNRETIEVNGQLGSIYWDLEHLNYLDVYLADEEPKASRGFHRINVTEDYHPYIKKWWPPGHLIGWEDTFVHTAYNIVNAVINDIDLEPMVATFKDGYRAAVICDAILKSASTGRKEKIIYLG